MRPRDILAANVIDLMARTTGAETLPALRKRSGISNGTLDRIRRAAAGASIDHLEPLAEALGVEPWELLVDPDQREPMRALAQALRAASKPPAAQEAEAPRRKRRAGG